MLDDARSIRDGRPDWPATGSPGTSRARAEGRPRSARQPRGGIPPTKRLFDVSISLALLPLLGVLTAALALLNPFLNRGPILFRQVRMGHGEIPFVMLKFRSMEEAEPDARGPADALEAARITPLGRWLRRTRLDELPQVLNVLAGEMSLIGPRPDMVRHARHYARTVPGYPARYRVRPGISGYAQVHLGYAIGRDAAQAKTELDLFYIRNASWRLELTIILATLFVMVSGHGAR